MDEKIRNRILKLLSLLTSEQKEKEIIEVDEKSDDKLIDYLKNDEVLTWDYELEYNHTKPYISENSGSINLWYKNVNGIWIINLYYINRILKNNN